MKRLTQKIVERGERRLRENGRRISPKSDYLYSEAINLVTESRNGWRAEAETRGRLLVTYELQIDALLVEKDRLEKLCHGQALLLKDADHREGK